MEIGLKSTYTAIVRYHTGELDNGFDNDNYDHTDTDNKEFEPYNGFLSQCAKITPL